MANYRTLSHQSVAVCVALFLAGCMLPAVVSADDKQETVVFADSLLPSQVFVNGGWAMGVASDALNQANDAPGSDKSDLSPFVNTGIVFGSGSGWTADIMVLYANFGRLVNKANVTEFNEASGTAVRQALMTDFSVMTRLRVRKNVGFGWRVINTGFIMDAQGRTDDENPLDAASYLFTGPSLFYLDDSKNRAIADLFVGISELMTGDEVFDFTNHAKPSIRIRPRFWLQFEDGLGSGRPLQIGFWGDLGIDRDEPDAVTAFVAIPLKVSAVRENAGTEGDTAKKKPPKSEAKNDSKPSSGGGH